MKTDPESWPILSRLLDEWLDLPEQSRPAWLENLGPENDSVLPVLRQLIAAQAGVEAAGFLNTLPQVDASTGAGAPLHAPFTVAARIGPYRLLRELGQGGMGVVWLAERADGELNRPVALKLPISSLHNQTLADRFTRERDILARLTHPCIARLYDAGVTDRGQPYLALEYVEGEQITSYCDQRMLGLKPRLRLFLQVLSAAQYAHTNLIVHRDLKPTNILVTNQGEARLLDFGIAKLLTEGQANETELTRIGGRALTPDYASPEQIAGTVITTASDVYSLGVILYELLTGGRPYKVRRHTRSGLEEAILAVDPLRPSQSGIDESSARARGLTPRRLARELNGDLDTIVLKALSKQPSQRYATADAFAQDIERYLNGEAVLAQPASAWYRTRKFVLRNKLVVGSAAAVVAALGIGMGVALWQAHVAQVQTRSAQTVRAFLLDIFRANSNQHADPVKARQTTARELLDIGAAKIDASLNDAPQAKLGLLETLFRLYVDLGLQDQAFPLGRKRIALAKSVYGPVHPEVARALVELASNSGESSFDSGRAELLNEAGSILDRNRDFQSLVRAEYYHARGNLTMDTDRAASAAFGAKSVELYRKWPPSRELVSALNFVGQLQNMQEQYPESVATLSEAAAVANSLQGEARRPLPAIYAILGDSQRHVLDFSGAEKSLRLALQSAIAIQGAESAYVFQVKWRLGVFLAQTARPREGLALLKEALDLAARMLGPQESFHMPMVRRGYGSQLIRYGYPEEGLSQLALAIDVQRRAKHSGTTDFASTLEWDSTGETDLGHYSKAEALVAEASRLRSNHPAPEELSYSLLARTRLQIATGRSEEAANSLQQSGIDVDPAGKITYAWLNVAVDRAEVDLARNRPDLAIQQARAVRSRIAASGLDLYFKRWDAQATLAEGKALLFTGHSSEALPLLQRALQLGSDVYDPDRSPNLADSQIALASCLLNLGRNDRARELLAQAKAIHATHKDLGEQFRKPLRELEARLTNRN